MHLFIFILAVLIAAVAQILLKMSADRTHGSFWREYINIHVIAGYVLFFVSTLLAIWGYRGLPLKIGPVLESLGYVLILILSYFIFKEKPRKHTVIGTLLIIVGIVIVII